MAFRPKSLSVKWIVAAFQTTTPKHQELQKISISVPFGLVPPNDVDAIKRSATYGEWMDLDQRLVQFWESRSARPKVIFTTWRGEKRSFTECFFPELTRRGAIDIR